MPAPAPVVYLLHGDDEYAIAQFLAELEAKLGEPSMAALNTTRLDGGSLNIEELPTIAAALPFLARRRLVILEHPLARLARQVDRERFLQILEKLPHTTALILVEHKFLTEKSEKRKGRIHWLENWAQERPDFVYQRAFSIPHGHEMERWIREQAKSAGGQFTPQAAAHLASLVGDDPRLAQQEIHKLLAYVGGSKPVEPEDVELLTTDSGQGNIFAMVDALVDHDSRQAVDMLHRLLETQDAFSIFGMVVRQFRLLLLARTVLDAGGGKAEMMKEAGMSEYVARLILPQARQFSLAQLELIYHRLLEIDEAMKTSQVEPELALDTLVAELTASPA